MSTESEPIEVDSERVLFAQIPYWVGDAVGDRGLRLYYLLKKKADNGSGSVRPTRPALAKELKWSLSTFDAAAAELEKLGALVVTRKYDTDTKRWSPNRYRVMFYQPGSPDRDEGVEQGLQAAREHAVKAAQTRAAKRSEGGMPEPGIGGGISEERDRGIPASRDRGIPPGHDASLDPCALHPSLHPNTDSPAPDGADARASLHEPSSTRALNEPTDSRLTPGLPTPPVPAPPPPAPDAWPTSVRDFATFWEHYPRKTHRAEAEMKWRSKARRDADPQAIAAGLKRWCDHWTAAGTAPIHMPEGSTWLTRCDWDETPPAMPLAKRNGTVPSAEPKRRYERVVATPAPPPASDPAEVRRLLRSGR